MKISDIILTKVSGTGDLPEFPPGDRQVRPTDLYPEPERSAGRSNRSQNPERHAIYIEVLTDGGVSGIFGPIQEAQAFVIQKSLRPFLIGKDPLATELLLDQMLRQIGRAHV